MNKTIAKGKLTNDLLTFQAWISCEEKTDEVDPAWKTFPSQRLDKWLKDLSRNLKQVDLTDDEAVRNLRIRVKKSRYILEKYAQQHDTRDTLRLLAKLKHCRIAWETSWLRPRQVNCFRSWRMI